MKTVTIYTDGACSGNPGILRYKETEKELSGGAADTTNNRMELTAVIEALALLKKAAADMSDGRFVPNEQTTLCRREDGMILNINLSVYELGIRNGSQLMLI